MSDWLWQIFEMRNWLDQMPNQLNKGETVL